jgi:hypothetical protein
MGYYVDILDTDIYLPKTSFQAACEHLKNSGFLTDTDNMSGGRFSDEGYVDRWYSWVNMDELAKYVEKGDLLSVFCCFSFGPETDKEGNLIGLWYSDKTGDEEHLLRSLEQFFQNENYIEWKGDDGEMWRDVFRNGKLQKSYPTIVWS